MSSIIPPDGISPFDSIRGEDGRWSARALQNLMGYARWQTLAPALERAKATARNEGLDVDEQFAQVNEVTGSRKHSERTDFRLTRQAAYLLAMNGDPNKSEVAAAQMYFATKTREAETQSAALALPQDYEEALSALLHQVRKSKALEVRVSALEPSAQAWERLASANGDFTVRVAANILNRDPNISTGQNRLFAVIRGMGMVGRDDIPYAKHAEHLRLKPGGEYEHPRTGEKQVGDPQLRVTIRGLGYLHQRLGGLVALRHHVQAELNFDAEEGAA